MTTQIILIGITGKLMLAIVAGIIAYGLFYYFFMRD